MDPRYIKPALNRAAASLAEFTPADFRFVAIIYPEDRKKIGERSEWLWSFGSTNLEVASVLSKVTDELCRAVGESSELDKLKAAKAALECDLENLQTEISSLEEENSDLASEVEELKAKEAGQ